MRKHPYEEPLDPTEQIHQAGDRNDYQNFPLFDFHKTINPTEESPQEEDFPEDFQEVAGDHRRYPYPRRIKENW